MEPDDYFHKQNFQNADHTADGKKKFRLTDEKKEQIVNHDLGREKMDDMSASAILQEMLEIMDADIGKAAGKNAEELQIFQEYRGMGQNFSGSTQAAAHKSLNAFRYGVIEMCKTWKQEGLKGPCALFQRKDGEMGYQERHRMFMEACKHECYDIPKKDSGKKFPDVSNTHYQSHSYAATELLVFCDDYQELVEEICDGKTKQGPNHLEGNVLKGLQDPDTLAELATMALEGVNVSWPYMGLIHSPPKGQKFVNTLSPKMVKLHCNKIIPFCENFALHPEKILDPATPLTKLTLDGEPLIDETIIPTLCLLAPDLPNLNLMIFAMFQDTANGWKLFTTEASCTAQPDPNDQ
ncbi:hypothetical protein BT96DRAFT_952080 [Gymnopus androsaceus JB14]|uniref:Uncharacterized protein n=1 Tax=Gymnopus androsaceus JB14 TaxID=1447944 RepID=A0A6A4GAR8_9AGAR|nr:hypothetical protein BT96DRAFT_952080 [Gymnopus androsaceus JB14]